MHRNDRAHKLAAKIPVHDQLDHCQHLEALARGYRRVLDVESVNFLALPDAVLSTQNSFFFVIHLININQATEKQQTTVLTSLFPFFLVSSPSISLSN